jgi:hypothetical protein
MGIYHYKGMSASMAMGAGHKIWKKGRRGEGRKRKRGTKGTTTSLLKTI